MSGEADAWTGLSGPPRPGYAARMARPDRRPSDIAAPEELSLPVHPAVASWRPADSADLDLVSDLHRAVSLADHPNHVTTRAGVAALFDLSYFDPDTDSLLALDDRGRAVAVGTVVLPTRYATLVRSLIVGGVHPDHRGRGIGRPLLEWQIARARQQLAEHDHGLPRRITAFTDARAPQTAHLYELAGLRLARHFFVLERPAVQPLARARPSRGVRLEPFTRGLSDAVHAARDEAFLDNWGSQPMSDEAWESFLARETFARELSFVALASGGDGAGEIAGFLMGTVNEADWENQGFSSSYVSMVGVRSRWRGRGIARALLASHIDASREAGYERVTLDVDSDGATGALGLYTGMGFTRAHHKLCYTIDL